MIESTDNGVNQSDYVLVCSPSSITSAYYKFQLCNVSLMHLTKFVRFLSNVLSSLCLG